MYPAMAEKNPDHSGTGVFYQAIPAVGADGRNIMKLIPVKMINGDFFNTQISRLNTIITPPKALAVNNASGPVAVGQKAASNPPPTEQIVRRQVPLMNATTYQVGSDLGYSLNKNPLQQLQQSVNLLAIVPPMAPVAKSGNPERPPVTVQSPVPHRIQCFQIPPQANVRTVPASNLLAVNKKQTFTPSAKLLCRTSKATSRGLPSKGSEPHFNLVPSVPQRPNSPIKWSIEEEDNLAVPAESIDSSVTSDILRLLSRREHTEPPRVIIRKPGPAPKPTPPSGASERLRDATERENTGKLCEVIIKSVTGSGQGTSGEKPGNPTFMWNGNQPQQQQNVRVMALQTVESPEDLQAISKSERTLKREVFRFSLERKSERSKHLIHLRVSRNRLFLPQSTPHQVLAYQVLAYPVLAYQVLAYEGLSYQVLAYPVLAYQVLAYQVLAYEGLSYQVLAYQVLAYPVLAYEGLFYQVLAYPVLAYQILAYPVLAYPVLAYPVRSTCRLSQVSSEVSLPKLLHNTYTSYRLPLNGSEPHLKLVPNVPQRPDSPIKWSVEDDGATAPSPDAIDSSVSLEILRVACVRENGEKQRDVLRNSASGSIREKGGQPGEENPSVMWNGKLFVFSKNCSPPDETGKSDAAIKSHEFDKSVAASAQQPLESIALRRKKNLGLLEPNRSYKVINLCDDDAPDDSSQRADEDTVIFVSYTPPAPEAQDSRPKTRTEEAGAGAGAASEVPEHESPDETRGAIEGGRLGQDVPVNAVEGPTRVVIPEVVTVPDDDDDDDDDGGGGGGGGGGRPAINGQQNTSTQQMEGMEVDSSSDGICFGLLEHTYNVESVMASPTSLPAPESRQLSDGALRRMFGITADVRIDLRRTDAASARSPPAEPPRSERVEAAAEHRETSSGFKDGELFTRPETERCDEPVDAKRAKVQIQQEPPQDSAPSQSLPECSHVDVPSVHISTCADVKAVSAAGYGEPIDEDFVSAEEEDFPGRRQTCTKLNVNPGRAGRKRKRPTCPCCVPGAPDPAAPRPAEEPEKPEGPTERTGKKGGRAKASSKDAKAAGSAGSAGSPTAKSKPGCKTAEDPPAAAAAVVPAAPSDELQLHEQISKLKELLQQKEAALQLMRTGRAEASPAAPPAGHAP
ncbi:hypothetical protein EYF80_036742 [Liparis tanakae]|uniref:Uncharacterized protein n=1 Tax=Liparis tanakae TaxID=230148 RepID=A0A4Z2GI39_9TELE|nr:hypothetical protein EYF80_036742 [Liparis tanakae]